MTATDRQRFERAKQLAYELKAKYKNFFDMTTASAYKVTLTGDYTSRKERILGKDRWKGKPMIKHIDNIRVEIYLNIVEDESENNKNK